MTEAPRPSSLRCEHRENPLGIDAPNPRFSWLAESLQRAGKQSAYQILVASAQKLLDSNDPDFWDSQKIESDQATAVPYAGRPLASAQQLFWKVRLWESDRASDWSETATFTMGLLRADDWRAKWIAADTATFQAKELPIFRRSLSLDKSVARAVVYTCGLGQFELHVNGKIVGNDVLDPGWTNYKKTCLYVAHDVTSLLHPGENVLGVMLGNGMYNVIGTPGRYKKFKASFGPPKLLLQMHLDFTDGSNAFIVSDESWRISPGPITFTCIFGGEDYDARLEQTGWDSPGFDDSHWQKPAIVDGPGGRLVARSAPPLRVMHSYPAKLTASPEPGAAVYDLSQNMSGRPSITATGPAGTTIKLIPGELLDPAGRVSQKSSGSPVYFQYTLRDGPQTWQPQFTYTGFRYLEAIAPPDVIHSLSGQFIHSSAPVVGEFSCSDPLLNQVHKLINAAILSNMQSVLTDCPHREKLGWLEQTHLMGPAIMFNYDVATLYAKMCADMRDAQHPDRCVPTIAPEYVVFKDKYADFSNSPEWGSAAVINPWLVYQQYGDHRILEDNFQMMRRYVEYLHTREDNGIIDFGLGDWYDIGPGDPGYSKLTSKSLTATAIYFRDLDILRRAALLLDDSGTVERCAALSERVRSAFNRKFLNPDSGQYDTSSQTANAMPLALGLVEPTQQVRVLENLVADIRSHDNHITAGDIGFRFVIDALANAGRSDVIYDLLCRTDPPSYGDQLRQGATTLTEAWDANPKNSQNHLMLGHAESWFYQHLAGIHLDLSQSASAQIVIKPSVVPGLEWAQATHQSVLGRIGSRWERQGNSLRLKIDIPFNAAAILHIPTTDSASVLENGKPFSQSDGVRFIKTGENVMIFQVGSGSFVVNSVLNLPN